ALLLRTGSAEAGPILKPARKLIMGHRWQRASFAWIPAPHYQFIGGHMLDDLRYGLAVILFWILDLPADLSGRAAFPNHRHVRRRQMPIRRSRRHIQSIDIVILMTRGALLAKLPFTVRSAPNVLNVYASIIALPREVTRRVTIETSRMFEHRNDRDEEITGARVVALDRAAGCLSRR